MKTVEILGKLDSRVIDVSDPKPKDDIVVVKVHSAPMCTEYTAFKSGDIIRDFGHEAAGEVAFIDKASKLKVGDRVLVQPQAPCGKCETCMQGDFIHCRSPRDYKQITGSSYGNGTMAQFVLKAEDYLIPIPDDMSYDHAAMGCCALGPSYTAMDLMQVGAFDTVMVSGLGPVGLGAVINATYRGAKVIGIDNHPYRKELAKKLGCSYVVDPTEPDALKNVMDYTKGCGVDKSVETSGRSEAKALLINVLRPKGQAALIGWNGSLDVNTIIQKGLTIYGAWHYNINHVNRIFKVINYNKDKLDILTTHKFPLIQINDAWKLQIEGNCGKVILHPWEE